MTYDYRGTMQQALDALNESFLPREAFSSDARYLDAHSRKSEAVDCLRRAIALPERLPMTWEELAATGITCSSNLAMQIAHTVENHHGITGDSE